MAKLGPFGVRQMVTQIRSTFLWVTRGREKVSALTRSQQETTLVLGSMSNKLDLLAGSVADYRMALQEIADVRATLGRRFEVMERALAEHQMTQQETIRLAIILSEKLDIVLDGQAAASKRLEQVKRTLVEETNLLDGNIIFHLGELLSDLEVQCTRLPGHSG
jgi:hypothetical protein